MSATHSSFQSTKDVLSVQMRQQLVDSLLQFGALHSTALQQAFLSIPREAFVPQFYEQDMTSRTMAWKLVGAHQMRREHYLAEVYRDQPLVTKIDERRWPVSSSSQPSAMAKMLEALAVKPGQRVLEIGTGSGYNAALLAHLTGDPRTVVTIEQDANLATHALHALEQVIGPGITVITGDGFAGWKPEAPYDRLIATASASTLPSAWLEQLRPGGKLVMDLQGTLASGFLVVEKTIAGMTGSFLPEPLYFMPLETEANPTPQVNVASLLQQPCQWTFVLQKEHIFPAILFNPAFRWFLQWRIPGCQISKRKQAQRDSSSEMHTILITEPANRAMVRLRRAGEEEMWQGEVYGPVPFWQDLQQAYEDFHMLGEPQQQMYQLVVEKEGPLLLIGSLQLPLPRAWRNSKASRSAE